MTEYIVRIALPTCKTCKVNGKPFLVGEEMKGKVWFWIDCELCTDDIVYCETDKHAMAIYNQKQIKKVAETDLVPNQSPPQEV